MEQLRNNNCEWQRFTAVKHNTTTNIFIHVLFSFLAESNFRSAQRRRKKRLQRHRRELALEKIRRKRTRLNSRHSRYSTKKRIDSAFKDSTEHSTPSGDNFSRWIDQHLDNEYMKDREEMLRIKRSREENNNNNSIELSEDEIPSKRAKVLVLPVPQYSFDELHAVRYEQCRSGLEFHKYYEIV